MTAIIKNIIPVISITGKLLNKTTKISPKRKAIE
jgi:hypothetical protein